MPKALSNLCHITHYSAFVYTPYMLVYITELWLLLSVLISGCLDTSGCVDHWLHLNKHGLYVHME